MERCFEKLLINGSAIQVEMPSGLTQLASTRCRGLKTGHFQDSVPHMMVLLPRAVVLQITSDPFSGVPCVISTKTEWEHLILPVGGVRPSFGNH